MARDGHEFRAWFAAPPGRPRGAVVVLQEIFGVNAHIRSVAERYAAAGFIAIAPDLFDRVGSGIELGYTPEDVTRARGTMAQVKREEALTDVAAAVNVARIGHKVALIGFCWGGTLTWLGARTLPLDAAVAYYASRIGENLDAAPKCPMLLHFGERDANIPVADVEKARALFPAGEFHLYPGGHGFACDARAAYDAASAELAWQRTQDFLARFVG